MNVIRLNTTSQDRIIVKKSEGGGGGSTNTKWTGHADAEGLKAIGWTDEDIQYYQENGVNWNAEDDEYHKVSEDNKALYGVLTADNIQDYKERIVYLPKIDTSGRTDFTSFLADCYKLVAIPMLDTSNAISTEGMFYYCSSLVCIPLIDVNNVIHASGMFANCYTLSNIPPITFKRVRTSVEMFQSCHSLIELDATQHGLPGYDAYDYMYFDCISLQKLKMSLLGMNTSSNGIFSGCFSLKDLYIDGPRSSVNDLYSSSVLSKDSLIRLIKAYGKIGSSVTIWLNDITYNRLADDEDVIASLEEFNTVSIALD